MAPHSKIIRLSKWPVRQVEKTNFNKYKQVRSFSTGAERKKPRDLFDQINNSQVNFRLDVRPLKLCPG